MLFLLQHQFALCICSMYSLYIMCVKITKKSRKKNIAGIMEIDEVKTQTTAATAAKAATTTTEATAASDEPTIRAMIDTNASQAEERTDDGQSDNERSDAKRTRGKRSKTLKLSKTLKALTGVRTLTSEERAVIIAKAKEIGVAEAAREFGINYYTIYTWLKKGKGKVSSKSEQSAKTATQTQSAVQSQIQRKTSNQKSSKSNPKKEAVTTAQVDEIKEMKDMKEIKREYIAEDVPVAPVEAVAPDKTVEAKELNKPFEVTMGKAVSVATVSASPAQIDEKQALLIENAILRERISAQKAEIEKLQAAIKSLMV